nr:hypothetical protein GCM10020241_10130 [Streptoalloteichus tenebrarius]
MVSATKPKARRNGIEQSATNRGWASNDRSTRGAGCRRSTTTKAASRTRQSANAPSTAGCAQPNTGPSTTPKANAVRLRVKETAPPQSIPCATGSRDSSSRRVATRDGSSRTATSPNRPRHPHALTAAPAITEPKASPTPSVVPNNAKARARPGPSGKAWASSALPLVATAAAPAPATALARTSSPMVGATVAPSIAATNRDSPAANIRRRPIRSAMAPVLAMKAAKVRKKAFTTHCAASRSARRSDPMSANASAAPVAVIGTSSIAEHTTARVVRARAGRSGTAAFIMFPLEL